MSKRSKTELIEDLTDLVRQTQVAQDVFDDAVSAAMGVNRTDFRVIDIVQRAGPIPVGHVAEQADLSPAAMTTSIDRLEKAGYVRRVPDPSDRRRVLVEATPIVEEQAWKIYGPLKMSADAQWRQMSNEQLAFLADFYRSSLDISREHLAKVRDLLKAG